MLCHAALVQDAVKDADNTPSLGTLWVFPTEGPLLIYNLRDAESHFISSDNDIIWFYETIFVVWKKRPLVSASLVS